MADAIKMGQAGPEVTSFQRMLLKKGFKLPKWGDDGKMGHETYNAALLFTNSESLDWPGKYDYKEVPASVVAAVMVNPGSDSPDHIVDVRHEHPINKGSKTPRDISTVTGIMLHQTSCFLKERNERWYDVACHLGITQSGKILYVNDLSAYMYHGHGFNRTTIGIEVDGNFCGVEGNEATLWRGGGGRAVLTTEQADGVRKAIRFICDEIERRGGKISTIVAHRQGSDQRQSDPGSAIWLNCGVWAQMELGLYNNPMVTKGTGYRIEYAYDVRGVVNWQNQWTSEGLRRVGGIMASVLGVSHNPSKTYDSAFKKLVSDFQSHCGIGVDGSFGPKTHATMEQKAGYRWTPEEEKALRGSML